MLNRKSRLSVLVVAFTIFVLMPVVHASSVELFNTPLYNDPNLVAYYRFEGDANDSKGSNNGAASNVAYGTSYGVFGQGASFTSALLSYINAGASTDFQLTGDFSINMWINLLSCPNGGTKIVGKWNESGNNRSYGLAVSFALVGSGCRPYSNISPDGQNVGIYFADQPSGISMNAWHMISFVRAGGSQYVYVDGNVFASGPATNPYDSGTNSNLMIGGAGGELWAGRNYSLDAYLDDLSIFNRALSATEIANLYTGNWLATTGTISVATNLSAATFTITGPATYSGSGTAATFPNTAAGMYTITYGFVAGYTTPFSQTQSLPAGGTITFRGNYACQPAPGKLPFQMAIIPDAPGFDTCPPKDLSQCKALDLINGCLMSTVSDINNNQFQLWCRVPHLVDLHLFAWYELVYVPANGDASKFAAKCPYEGGVDYGTIYYSAADANSTPMCFVGSRWDVADGGIFDDEASYLPWSLCPSCKPYSWSYGFDVASNLTTAKHTDPSGTTIGGFTQDPLPDFNNLPPVLDLAAIPAGGVSMGAAFPGDVNVDGRVDCADLMLVRGALGTRNGEPGFLLQADVDRDGVVDLRDLASVIQKFSVPGTACPSLVSFPIVVNDIQGSLNLSLIDNHGIANSLLQKIEAASEAVAQGHIRAATDILNSLTNELQAQVGKQISTLAAALLLNDVASLIGKINA